MHGENVCSWRRRLRRGGAGTVGPEGGSTGRIWAIPSPIWAMGLWPWRGCLPGVGVTAAAWRALDRAEGWRRLGLWFPIVWEVEKGCSLSCASRWWNATFRLRRRATTMAVVRASMDGVSPVRWVGTEMCDNTDECPVPPVLVPAATAPVGVVPLLGRVAEVCRHSPRSHLELIVVSGRKSWFGAGLARWRRPRHRSYVGSIAFGDTAWRSYVALLRCSSLSKLIFRGAIYVVADESKAVPFSGLTKSRYVLATSYRYQE